MKYFIPEWDDRVDPDYDFLNDDHSRKHKANPYTDYYMWEIFGLDKLPFDGVLVSRVKIEESQIKKNRVLQQGIHKFLRLPQDFQIIGDCGAFGYIDAKEPKYDALEILDYYRDTGFNIGVSVDHLVVPKYKNEKKERMKITLDNGIRSFDEWAANYKNDFELLCSIQGLVVDDYIGMFQEYVDHGVADFGVGGLVRQPTKFIAQLIDGFIHEIKDIGKPPHRLHFFGLARQSLFPYFQKLESLGVEVSFDSASYLRRAWLSAQNNYMTLNSGGYSAIRVPQIGKKTGLRGKNKLEENVDLDALKLLEQNCLKQIRTFDEGKTELDCVLNSLKTFDEATGQNRFSKLKEEYVKTLRDSPWKKCECVICRSAGVETIIFRGNNRNRRRGFHNVRIFYKILKNPDLWKKKIVSELKVEDIKKNDRVLVITSCTKKKLSCSFEVKATAKDMYQGRLFKTVRTLCDEVKYDYVIISAKYGLLFPNDLIEGYEKVIRNKKDVEAIQPQVIGTLKKILNDYDKIIIIAGANYLRVVEPVIDDRFSIVRSSKGYGDLCKKVNELKKTLTIHPIEDFM